MTEEQMANIIANSYRNFHAKDMHYLCLMRSPAYTEKYYFFDGQVENLPEVVNPHDHRYNFNTVCLSGAIENFWFEESKYGTEYNAFDYLTPLNGGHGFTEAGTKRLYVYEKGVYEPGQAYYMRAEQMHTINVRAAKTVIKLEQYEDVVPLYEPTQTFSKDANINASGDYTLWTEDQVIKALATIKSLT